WRPPAGSQLERLSCRPAIFRPASLGRRLMRSCKRLLETAALGAVALGLCLAPQASPASAQTAIAPPTNAPAVDASGTAPQPQLPLPTLPNSNVVDIDKALGSTKTEPAFSLLPRYVPGSSDWSRPYADLLDAQYAKWTDFKDSIASSFNLTFGIDYSFYPQW